MEAPTHFYLDDQKHPMSSVIRISTNQWAPRRVATRSRFPDPYSEGFLCPSVAFLFPRRLSGFLGCLGSLGEPFVTSVGSKEQQGGKRALRKVSFKGALPPSGTTCHRHRGRGRVLPNARIILAFA